MVKGGSRITGSFSVWEKLLVWALETKGADGAGTGGTIWSGSRKYIHLELVVSSWRESWAADLQMDEAVVLLWSPLLCVN